MSALFYICFLFALSRHAIMPWEEETGRFLKPSWSKSFCIYLGPAFTKICQICILECFNLIPGCQLTNHIPDNCDNEKLCHIFVWTKVDSVQQLLTWAVNLHFSHLFSLSFTYCRRVHASWLKRLSLWELVLSVSVLGIWGPCKLAKKKPPLPLGYGLINFMVT